MSNEEKVIQKLHDMGIPFACYEHEPAMTMEECLRLPYAEEDVTFCKNILLCNRQQSAYYLYVTLPDKPFRTSQVSHALRSSRLSFAPPERLPVLLGLESGSLSPLGLWFDVEKRVQLVFDAQVKRPGKIAFHPCDNSATCVFEQEVFWRKVVPKLERDPIWIET